MALDLRSWARRAVIEDAPVRSERSILALAHRGASAEFPENTRAAFAAAVEAEVHGIELDLQLTRDDVPVVYHDRTLEKLGAPWERIAGTDLDALLAKDAGGWFHPRFAGERVLTLDQVLDAYAPRVLLLLEIKARDRAYARHARLLEKVVAALRVRGLLPSVLLLCFDGAVLEIARGLAPELRTVQNFRTLPRDSASTRAALDPLFALSIDVRALSPVFVRRAHERGKPVLTYTCNTARALERALGAGVDGVMSDRPAWLVELLRAGVADGREA